jgi:hypothetical protein
MPLMKVMPFTTIHGGNMTDYIICFAMVAALYFHLISDSVVVI